MASTTSLAAGANVQASNLNTAPSWARSSNDDRADWRKAWEHFPRRRRLCLARRSAQRRARCRSPGAGRLRDPLADHLGKDRFASAAATITGSTSLLVRGPQGTGRWHGDRKQSTLWQIAAARRFRTRPRHAEAGRVHEAPDREQLLARPGDLRAVLRLRHDHHRGRDHRPVLPRDRADAAVCRCRGRALAGVHRRDGQA